MSTKTKKLPTPEQAEAELDEAREHHAGLKARVVEGDTTVSPDDIAKAEDAIEFAELRLELAKNTAAHEAEVARQAAIAEVVESLTSGAVYAKGRRLVDLETKATAALAELMTACDEFSDALGAARVELGRLHNDGPLPDGIKCPAMDDRAAFASGSLIVHGVRFHHFESDFAEKATAGAIDRARYQVGGRWLRSKRFDAATSYAKHRKHPERLPDGRVYGTYIEGLAEDLDRLDATADASPVAADDAPTEDDEEGTNAA